MGDIIEEDIIEKDIIETPQKSISEVGVSDIQFSLDNTKSYEQQAEDVVGAMATAKAVSDEGTAKDIAEKKAEELKSKANRKLQSAQAEEINATVERQEAARAKNEAVLQTFGINKHLPDWLLKTMVIIFSPVYIFLTITIGIPCGIVKVLIDNIDNILVRYENAKSTYKPKIKVAVWIILGVFALSIIAVVLINIL